MVNLAYKNLLHDKLRFLMTVADVAFAVTLVVVQIGLFIGILENATITIEKLNADIWITSRNTPNIDFPHAFPESHVNRVRALPQVARADNLIITYVNIALPNGAEELIEVYALDDFAPWHFPWNIAEGDPADLKRGRYFFLDDSATKRFGPFAIGEYREMLGNRLRIVGRSREARSFTTTPLCFMDYHQAQQIDPLGLTARTTYIIVKLLPGANIGEVQDEIKKLLPFNDVYTQHEWHSKTRNYWLNATGLGFNMFLTVFLGCLVGVVIVAQTLYSSTMEHLKEFGTLKAIGGSNAMIYGILARQAIISAIVGYALGIAPAYLIRPLVERADLKLFISPLMSGLVFAGTLLMCLGAAMISFRKVANIDPALVFRS